MLVNPPLKMHGGKNYLASRIHEIARRTSYVHRVITHAGGLGEFWNWEHEGVSEVVNDINGWVVNFYEVLRDENQFEKLKRYLECTPFAEPIFEAAKAVMDGTPLNQTEIDPVTSAAWFFVCCRQSMAGRMESFTPLSRNRTRRGMNEGPSAWMTAIEGLPAAHARLMRAVIFNKDFLEVIRQQDGPNTLFYEDPTYMPDERTAPDVYAYEMTCEQHGLLLEANGAMKGKFILSGYDNPLYREAEKRYGWNREEIEIANHAASGASKRRMVEVIWTNF